jgi:hypothetical protein
VAIARKNLATTIGLLQLFRSIPQKAEELSDKLNDDRQLKNIYKELRRMIALRDRAFTKGMEFAGVSGMSDTVKESFDALQRVALDVEDRYPNLRITSHFCFNQPSLVWFCDVQNLDEYSRLFGSGPRRSRHAGAYLGGD